MKLAWMTDPHLNFVERQRIDSLAREVRTTRADAVLIGGDIGEAHNVIDYLRLLSELIPLPIYFVLGNHDFYQGSITAVRDEVEQLTRSVANLHYLPISGVVTLTPSTGLIGHDGWGDGGFGDAKKTPVLLNDFRLIEELRQPTRAELLRVVAKLGEEAAEHFRAVLPDALEQCDEVFVLTHVPPFAEAAWHQGRSSDDNWLPWFACRAVGWVLREKMSYHPDKRMTVLCGHTHGSGECQILPNLRVWTGGATYGEPRVQQVIEV